MTEQLELPLDDLCREDLLESLPKGVPVLSPAELYESFNVVEHLGAGTVRLQRKSDGVLGWGRYQECPRFYWGFRADR